MASSRIISGILLSGMAAAVVSCSGGAEFTSKQLAPDKAVARASEISGITIPAEFKVSMAQDSQATWGGGGEAVWVQASASDSAAADFVRRYAGSKATPVENRCGSITDTPAPSTGVLPSLVVVNGPVNDGVADKLVARGYLAHCTAVTKIRLRGPSLGSQGAAAAYLQKRTSSGQVTLVLTVSA
ncbi:hypothetical protein P0W64_21180 [Tsukamurella sp. 8F]|uniref:hypothetical protein n=1 Tax=unclassified Tsukamurella TaxID=2633480 RepID=UPI0023B8EB52|nr:MULTISPECIES: hypothetical protein [unclassified Tsukamurella]MDF0532271.1 hypothetical protein [Tsukamurella sp. 8J]MDF0589297.1 hypothetical protein [Tsukamurella sp. 8F]